MTYHVYNRSVIVVPPGHFQVAVYGRMVLPLLFAKLDFKPKMFKSEKTKNKIKRECRHFAHAA